MAGVFWKLWQQGLLEYDELSGIKWDWQSIDGAITKAPLGGEKTGPKPTDRAKSGTNRSLLTDGDGVPLSMVTSSAQTHDSKLFQTTLENIILEKPKGQHHICADKALTPKLLDNWQRNARTDHTSNHAVTRRRKKEKSQQESQTLGG